MSDERYLSRLAEAVRIPTVSYDHPARIEDSTFLAFREWLESAYPRIFADLQVESVGHTLLLEWTGADRSLEPVLFLAHQDVVPVEPGTEDHWDRPPFSGDRHGGYLWGRGALDMKGALVGVLEAIERLIETGHRPTRSVMVVLGHDEERGGVEGARAAARLLTERGVRPLFIVDEGGFVTQGVVPGVSAPVALIGVSEKGHLVLELSVEGDAGHAGAPPRHTSIGRLAKAITRLESRRLPARPEVVLPLMETVAEQAQGPVRRLYRGLARMALLRERLLAVRPDMDALMRTTGAVTVVEGGGKVNALPARARAIVNYRIVPGDSIEMVMSHVRERVGPDVRLRRLATEMECQPPPPADTSSRAYSVVADAVRTVHPGTVVAPWVLVALTDSRHFVHLTEQIYRFTPFRVGRADLARFHGHGERVRESDAAPAVAFYRTVIERSCG